MIKLLVAADDFTGALDTGVQFAKKGVPTLALAFDWLDFNAVDEDIEVLIVDTESRHISAEKARERIRALVKSAADYGVKHFYKKTDSTLRGNIGAELEGFLDALGGELSFVPAFPKTGRTTKKGVQYVDGVALADTPFAQDPFSPVNNSEVAAIIAEQSAVATNNVYAGEALPRTLPGERLIHIFDAETDEDLRRIGSRLKAENRLHALAGCAGFSEVLPALLELGTKNPELPELHGSALIISGSINRVSLAQIGRAEEYGYPTVALKPRQKLDHSYAKSPDCTAFVEQIDNLLQSAGRAAICAASALEQIHETDLYAEERGIHPAQIRGLIQENIGEIASCILKKVRVDKLVVFGGDTLYGILERIGCKGVFPVTEITPGVVLARINSDFGAFTIVTKAGGFGGEGVIGAIDSFIFGTGHTNQ
jgi:uncharacterized protein YgbK (DUF1537 family)